MLLDKELHSQLLLQNEYVLKKNLSFRSHTYQLQYKNLLGVSVWYSEYLTSSLELN